MKTPATDRDEATIQRASRLRGVRFLAAHALAAGDAYAFHVGPDGLVSIQGEQGALQRLVQMFAARPVAGDPDGLDVLEWKADVPFEGGIVVLELIETL